LRVAGRGEELTVAPRTNAHQKQRRRNCFRRRMIFLEIS
jgi:hypothetical protein